MRIVITAFALFITAYCSAQPVQIGEKIPDVILKHMFNYKKSQANLLTEFGGKPMIIDFWFIHCAACVKNILVLDSLQKQYKSQLNILLCTYEPENKVREFFTGKQSFRSVKLSSVVSDSALTGMFPHHSSPHEIWIDRNGIVQAITEASYVNQENINLLIQGKRLNLPIKEEPDMDVYMGELPYMQIEQEYNQVQNTLQYSFLCGYDPHMHGLGASAAPYKQIPGYLRIHASNLMLSSLYQLAYFNATMHRNQLIVESKDSLKDLLYDTSKKRSFCYDFIGPGPEWRVYRAMQKDLDAHFSIKSFYGRKKMKCLVLTRTSATSGRFIAEGGASILDREGSEFSLKNISLQAITFQDFYIDLPLPLVDETGYQGEVTIQFPTTFSDLQSFNKYLLRYDLELREEERVLDVIYLVRK